MLEASQNFGQMAFHRIGCIDKCITETMNDTGTFNSLRNIVIVNTADSIECCLMEISPCVKHCFWCRSSKFQKTTLHHKNSPRIKMPSPELMNLVSVYLKKNFLSNEINSYRWHFVNDIVEITDHSLHMCYILSGPPCIELSFQCYNSWQRLDKSFIKKRSSLLHVL